MAQPTDAEHHFEVSEPSEALPVPTLSRYARPVEADRPVASSEGAADDGDDRPERDETIRANAQAPLAGTLSIDPIIQPAGQTWATDPSPPVTVPGSPSSGASSLADALIPAAQQPRRARVEPNENPTKRPFWKRLSMARGSAEPAPPTVLPPEQLTPVIERIDHLTRRFEREQKGLRVRLDEFEQNITRLWEIEEQLSLNEVRERLAVLQANQEDIADGLHALARNVSIGVGLIFAAVAAALVIAVL